MDDQGWRTGDVWMIKGGGGGEEEDRSRGK